MRFQPKKKKIVELKELINRRENEFEQLLQKWESLQKENDVNKRKITKLEENITELNMKKMKVDDDVAVKLKQYEIQVITIDENKKLIEKYDQQIAQLKTENQLLEEEIQRQKKRKSKL